jgi:hypothetical protein
MCARIHLRKHFQSWSYVIGAKEKGDVPHSLCETRDGVTPIFGSRQRANVDVAGAVECSPRLRAESPTGWVSVRRTGLMSTGGELATAGLIWQRFCMLVI